MPVGAKRFLPQSGTINYFKYEDETEEERTERLKRQEMLDKWRKQFK